MFSGDSARPIARLVRHSGRCARSAHGPVDELVRAEHPAEERHVRDPGQRHALDGHAERSEHPRDRGSTTAPRAAAPPAPRCRWQPRRQRADRVAGHHLPQPRAVLDGARDRADRVERAHRAAHAIARQTIAARLEPDEPAERGRDADAAEAVAADAVAREPGGDRDRGARARAARRVARRARVVGHGVAHHDAEPVDAELGHLRLADNPAAGRRDARDNRRVARRGRHRSRRPMPVGSPRRRSDP